MAASSPASSPASTWLRVGLGVVGLVLFAVLAAGGWAWSTWRTTLSPTCAALPAADLSIDEVIALVRRKKAYQRGQANELVLDSTEINFVMKGASAWRMHVRLDGDRVDVRAALPVEAGCYNIRYRGGVAVDDGVARLDVAALEVGDATLTWLARWYLAEVEPGDLADEALATHLGNTSRLRVQDGAVHLALVDPWVIW